MPFLSVFFWVGFILWQAPLGTEMVPAMPAVYSPANKPRGVVSLSRGSPKAQELTLFGPERVTGLCLNQTLWLMGMRVSQTCVAW